MSKIIRTRKPSVLPYYAAALAFVVLCAVLSGLSAVGTAGGAGRGCADLAGAKRSARSGWWRRKCPSIPVWTMWMPC